MEWCEYIHVDYTIVNFIQSLYLESISIDRIWYFCNKTFDTSFTVEDINSIIDFNNEYL